MALDLRQNLKLTQQLVMTPQLQMAIKLLQLNRLELAEMVQQELAENPALEEQAESAESESEKSEENSPDSTETEEAASEVSVEEKITDQIEWENYLNEYNSYGGVHFENESRQAPQYESFIASQTSLKDHLLWQFLMTLPSDEEEHIASLIIGSVNDDGYLETSLDDIALAAHVSAERAGGVLAVLKTFDPPGVCSSTLTECLLTQLNYLGISTPVLRDIICHHLKNLESKNYKKIAKDLKISLHDTLAAVDVIQRLDPKPARKYKQDNPTYIIPDIYVYKFEDDFVVVLNDDDLPRLHISPYYRTAMKHHPQKISKEAREYLQEKIRSASWLIKSIQQRQKTIYNVMNSILKFQREFFEKGVQCLKPMILRDVAEDIGMHESTISRVTTGKYAHTPQGLFELKYFFNSSINRFQGDSVASASVQEIIRQIIKNEDPQKPYSDDKISAILKQSNIDIARRTVTKYREALGLLSSTKRKQF